MNNLIDLTRPKKNLNYKDVSTLGYIRKSGIWVPYKGSVAHKYIKLNKYKYRSNLKPLGMYYFPFILRRYLYTKKFAKYLIEHSPTLSKQFKLTKSKK